MARPEDLVQRAILDYIAVAAPAVFVYAIPNAARRAPSGNAGNAVPGLRPGMPDLGLIWQGKAYFIEVKAGKGTISAAQCDTAGLLHTAGAQVTFCWSIDDVRHALDVWGIASRDAERQVV